MNLAAASRNATLTARSEQQEEYYDMLGRVNMG
jgi:hypothetical protein